MRSTITIVALFSLVPAVLGSQTLPGLPQFEVASIRPTDTTNPQRSVNVRGGELKATNYSLKNLIQVGWDVRSLQVLGGPDWLDSDKFNVDAKPPAALEIFGGEGQRHFRLMVQSLLADRFRLTLHRETKDMRVYFLVVGRNGSSLKRTAEAIGPGTSMNDGNGRLTATQIDMGMLAHELGSELGVPVIDKTNLDGAFDIRLEWNPDDDSSAPASGSSPSIFTAIQEQLGLRLDVGRGPVEILRVDHAERPSET